MSKSSVMKLMCGLSVVAVFALMQGCKSTAPKEPLTSTCVLAEPEELVGEQDEAVKPLVLPVVQLTTPYTVVKGDTLSAIAKRYGLRWQDVAATNPDLNPAKLRIGQVIQLPGEVSVPRQAVKGTTVTAPKTTVAAPAKQASAPATEGRVVTYKIKSGDTLSGIAYRYGVKVATLKADNNLKSDVIIAGRDLKITNPTRTPVPVASAVKAQPTKTEPAKKPLTAAPVKAATSKPATPVAAPVEKPKQQAVAAPTVKVEQSTKVVEATKAEVKAVEVKPVEVVEPVVEVTVLPAPPALPSVESVKQSVAEVAYRNYIVKEGEDLFAVAIRWGVSPNEIKAVNGLTGNDLKAGTELKIPIPSDNL
ncbi:MAG: LysM peptidoglycan-binding domain-containing protein [Lentisphaerae bacterium]|nr:LysM peptidoglycan-binding domain-containing protein [Lentisphaerota bacterium]